MPSSPPRPVQGPELPRCEVFVSAQEGRPERTASGKLDGSSCCRTDRGAEASLARCYQAFHVLSDDKPFGNIHVQASLILTRDL